MADDSTAATSPLIPNVPDDISLQILARIPRSHHRSLSLVSTPFRSTVSSPDLFHTRSLLHTTESSLFLHLRFNSSSNWYYSHQIPKSPTRKTLTLIPLPPMPQHPIGASITALGPKIYVIGGSINDIPTNNLWAFDCRFRKWEMGPRMKVAREFSAAEVWDERVYVMGGCNVDNWSRSVNWSEVFDPKTGCWTAVGSSGVDLVRDKWMHASAVIEGRIYAMADRGGVVYDVGRGEWASVPKRLDLGWRGRAAVVGGVLYCYDYLGKIRGYDVERDVWRELRGVDKGLPKFMCSSTMVDLDGKLCVVWEGRGSGKEVEIMCAEIEVEKDADGGLRGRVLRMDVVLVVPKGTSISHCLNVKF